jgi:putative protease
MAFSRGLYTGWFRGINNQQLVHARFGTKRGVYLGTVTRVEKNRIAIQLQAPLKAGDGVVFDAGNPEVSEEGGRVYRVDSRGDETWLSFGPGAIDFGRVQPNHRVWKTSDPELERRLRKSFTTGSPQFLRPLSWEVHGLAGTPLTLITRDELGNVAQCESAMPLATAERQPLDEVRLKMQLGRLGGTGFRLDRIESRLEGGVLIPVSELNRMRRDLVEQITALRAKSPRWTLLPDHPAAGQITGDQGNQKRGSISSSRRVDRTRSRPGATSRRVALRNRDCVLRI